MSKREESFLILDIKSAINNILKYTDGYTSENFLRDDKTKDAVVRNFEIIGEASKMVSDDTKLLHPLIDWRLMTDFRNRLIHEYFGVDYNLVWDIIVNELPELKIFLDRIE